MFSTFFSFSTLDLFESSKPTNAKLFYYFEVIRYNYLQVSMCTFVTEDKSSLFFSHLFPLPAIDSMD